MDGIAPPSTSIGSFWAGQYRQSSHHQKYVGLSQAHIAATAKLGMKMQPKLHGGSRDWLLRQIRVLTHRHFDLIRHDMRTLFILLLMMPMIVGLFAVVSGKEDLAGTSMESQTLQRELKAELRGAPVGDKADYVPAPAAIKLITMLCLALTQAGTFGAAYEIVKERAIFKRERAVNLKVGSYILSKMLVLGTFAAFQVACAIAILSLKVDLHRLAPVFCTFRSAPGEIFISLLLAVLASILLGLFISAVVPSADAVIYVILVQLFVQIILAGTLFPLPDNPASKMVISRWAIDAVGATVNIRQLNELSQVCKVIDVSELGGSQINCAASPISDADLGLGFEHNPRHLLTTWIALIGQALLWGILTLWVQSRKSAD